MAVPLPASHGNHETRGKLRVVKHFQFSGWISWIPWIIFSWKSSNNCFLCCILNTNTYSAPIVSTRSIISILSHIRCGVQPMSLSGLSSIVPSVPSGDTPSLPHWWKKTLKFFQHVPTVTLHRKTMLHQVYTMDAAAMGRRGLPWRTFLHVHVAANHV